jgi:hypothetical protein
MSLNRVRIAMRKSLSFAIIAACIGSGWAESPLLADGGEEPQKTSRLRRPRTTGSIRLASFQDPDAKVHEIGKVDAGTADVPTTLELRPLAPPQDTKSRDSQILESEPMLNPPPMETDAGDELEVQSPSPRNMEPLRVKPLQMPDISLIGIGTGTTPEDATAGRLPSPIPLPFGPDRDGGWSMSTYTWIPPVYCHKPTYYEDVMLEHHGHERCPPLQPLLSGARFYSGLFFTPYLAYLHPPGQDISNAGHYRVGTSAPGLRQRAPYDAGAIRMQLLMTGTGVLALQP